MENISWYLVFFGTCTLILKEFASLWVFSCTYYYMLKSQKQVVSWMTTCWYVSSEHSACVSVCFIKQKALSFVLKKDLILWKCLHQWESNLTTLSRVVLQCCLITYTCYFCHAWVWRNDLWSFYFKILKLCILMEIRPNNLGSYITDVVMLIHVWV